jgi:hypothetical protein
VVPFYFFLLAFSYLLFVFFIGVLCKQTAKIAEDTNKENNKQIRERKQKK